MPLNGNSEPPVALVDAALEIVSDGAVDDLKGCLAAGCGHEAEAEYQVSHHLTPLESDEVWTLTAVPTLSA